jgi:hypothetical protein
MARNALSRQALSPRPSALLCLVILIVAAGCGNDFEHVHGTPATEEAFAAPVIKSPADGAEIGPTDPVLAWETVPSAVSFHVEVSVNADFQTLEEEVEDVPVTSFMISDFPMNEGRHFWRVRARNASNEWSPWSTVSSFIVVNTTIDVSKEPRAPVAAPPLIAPGDGYTTGMTGPGAFSR